MQPQDPRQLDTARVVVQGSTALVRFADVVVTVGLSPGMSCAMFASSTNIAASPFEDVLALSDRNAYIGMGSVPSSQRRGGPSVLLMPAKGGLLGVEVYTPPILLERKWVWRGKVADCRTDAAIATDSLKSKMEQAVFYGDRPEASR